MKRCFFSVFAILFLAVLLLAATALAEEPKPEIGTVMVKNDGNVNVRSGSDTDSPIVGMASPNAVYSCTGRAESGWYEILFEGEYRYIAPGKVAYSPLRAPAEDLSTLNERIQTDPGDALAYVERGEYYHWQGAYEDAYADFTQAIALDGTAGQYAARGATLFAMDALAAAEADARAAIALDSACGPAYHLLGLLLLNEEKPDEALEQFLSAAQYDKTNAETCNEIGLIYRDVREEYKEAVKWFGEAINRSGGERSTTIAMYFYNRGESYFLSEDIGDSVRKGIADVEAALRLKEDIPQAYFLMFVVYDAIGDLEKGLSYIEKGIELFPDAEE